MFPFWPKWQDKCVIFSWQHPASGFPCFYTMCIHDSEILPPVSCDSSLPLCLKRVCNTIFTGIFKKALELKDSIYLAGNGVSSVDSWLARISKTLKSPYSSGLFPNCAATGLDVALALTAGLFMHLYGDLAVVLCRLLLWPPNLSG